MDDAITITGVAPWSFPSPIHDVFVGGATTCVLLEDDSVWCWGGLSVGVIGDPGIQPIPTRMASLRNVAQIALGAVSACAVLRDGTVTCWGGNQYGQLGDGTTIARLDPLPVEGIHAAVQATAGDYHVCVATSDQRAYCWGGNFWNQLANGSMIDSPRPVPLGAGLDGIVEVAGGSLYTCVRRTSGPVLCWGGYDRVWGTSTTGSPIQGTASATQIAAGGAACARLADGTMTCFGSNGAVPWSYTSFWSSAPLAGLSGIAEARVGHGNFDAWMSDGTLQTLGSNDDGQLGVDMHFGRLNPEPVPGLDHIVRLAVGPQHSCALRADESLWCWGENYYGQVGTGSPSNDLIRVPTLVAH